MRLAFSWPRKIEQLHSMHYLEMNLNACIKSAQCIWYRTAFGIQTLQCTFAVQLENKNLQLCKLRRQTVIYDHTSNDQAYVPLLFQMS